jgi:hypothetical protein
MFSMIWKPCFSDLNLIQETPDEVLLDDFDAVGCSEEGKDIQDEVAFVFVELVCPVMEIFRSRGPSPEERFCLLVHLPDATLGVKTPYLQLMINIRH